MIPTIIHQIWIGPKKAPIKMMDTWKDKHPEFEYIRWTEDEIKKRNMIFKCQNRIDEIEEYCGKADIIRLEILNKYGGIYIDADSICIEPIDNLLNCNAFACWENESIRKGLISNGNIGFIPNHPFVCKMIEWIKDNKVSMKETGYHAWEIVGPILFTNTYNTIPNDVVIYPSYYFLPIHYSGYLYNGHSNIYAYQEWNSTKEEHNNTKSDLTKAEIPKLLTFEPIDKVSVLIPSYNTPAIYLKDCFESIRNQTGNFFMEILIVDDCSNDLCSKILQHYVSIYKYSTRNCNWILYKLSENIGVAGALQFGLERCTYNTIVRMDSDDIMKPDRIEKQLKFMKSNKDCVMCGTQIDQLTNEQINNIKEHKWNDKCVIPSSHPEIITLDDFNDNDFKIKHSLWFVNHPTVMFQRDSILSVGGYIKKHKGLAEDFNLWLRVLKKYKKIYNLQESLLIYRNHEKQTTKQNGWKNTEEIQNKWIEEIIFSDSS